MSYSFLSYFWVLDQVISKISCFLLPVLYLFVHTFNDSSSARTNGSLSSTVTVTYFYSSTSTWKFPCNDKDNSHTSLYSHEHRSSLTHSLSDAISKIDDLTSEAALGPASTTTHCPCCSYRRPEDKAERAYPY